jgi:peptidoglycan/xylan/chitin deacetylase (PgdA/CDA1 family)
MTFNINKLMLLIFVVCTFWLSACTSKQPELSTPPEPSASLQAPTVQPTLLSEIAISVTNDSTTQSAPEHLIPKNPEYNLEIKGSSNQLSPKALKSMTLWRESIIAFAQKHRESIYINGPDQKMVALTFDDGPDNINTPAIIDSLKKYNVKGSFFFVGSLVKRYPDVVRYAFENGNLVLGHSYNHDDLTKKTKKEIQTDLKQTEKAIEDVIGKKPALMRTPYGETDEKVESAISETGSKIILWSLDTMDWSQRESENIKNNVINNIRNGDIILMHSNSGKSETAKAVPMIIEELQKRNYNMVDLETMLHVKAYK